MALCLDQHRQRAALEDEHEGRSADHDDAERGQKTGQRDRMFEERGGHARRARAQIEIVAEHVLDILVQRQRHQERATDDGHGQEDLERGFRDELQDHDRPVGGSEEGASLDRKLQGRNAHASRRSAHPPL